MAQQELDVFRRAIALISKGKDQNEDAWMVYVFLG